MQAAVISSAAHQTKKKVGVQPGHGTVKLTESAGQKEKEGADLIASLSEAAEARCLSSFSSFVVCHGGLRLDAW